MMTECYIEHKSYPMKMFLEVEVSVSGKDILVKTDKGTFGGSIYNIITPMNSR
ncbi:unnamed protein product [marine sediment metagenome]|uniref:Uncharacterized protein n=1 Tax=marine sediment metagenome TaxID=412755 RepID=X1F5R1_9ZZZZ